ncbi:MAG TPA: alpha/beta fold hydrolase [Bryobacteraceae bacterium]|nr:alpha/beta fold hydrolase [Bryobacteraceae bacterium]
MLPRILCAAFSVALALAQSGAADPAATARKALDLFLGQNYAGMRQMFSPEMAASPNLAEDRLQDLGKTIQALGSPKIGDAQLHPAGTNRIVVIPVVFSAETITFQLTMNSQGQVAGFFMARTAVKAANPWEHPAYSKADAFHEREVTFGDDPWKLPGTLTVPVSAGPHPAVVLVQGSGPNDRDESLGPNKIFRDLAEGLASRGIVVLRYEKRTRQYQAKMAVQEDMTVLEETVDDAVAAAAFLRQQPEVDPKRVFVTGHSLGGNQAPRIAEADDKLAGIVILAGNVTPLEDAIVDQSEYLGASAAQLQLLKAEAAKVKRLDDGDEGGPPVTVGPVTAPVSYWLDLKSYDPVGAAKKLTIPVLVLQGERDYQVTMKDFELWKAGLGARKNVTLKSYPALNHLFIAGEGKSMPDEYAKAGHVAPEVVDDIARFITQ